MCEVTLTGGRARHPQQVLVEERLEPREVLDPIGDPEAKLTVDDNEVGVLIEMATGRESRADSALWVAGGLTKGGASEAVIKAIPREELIKLLAKGTIKQKREIYPETRDNIV